MAILKPKIRDYPGKHIKIEVNNPDLDFAEAMDISKQKEKKSAQIKGLNSLFKL